MNRKKQKICFFVFTFLGFLVAATFLATVAHANIILKLMSVNPSKEQTQKTTIKAYLPKETKPENVVNKGDLEMAYDSQQGSYYVYGEFELKPGETLERDIELSDIWVIPNADTESLRQEAVKLTDSLKGTDFAERATFLMNSVESKLNQVLESQKASPSNPERHISEYRENMKAMESAKADIALARSMLSQTKPFPTVMVWKLIAIIIIFLGVIGGAFYLVWQKQLKTIAHDTFYVPKDDSDAPENKPAEEKDSSKDKDDKGAADKTIEEEDDLL
jgi:hypothetical protein